MKMINVMNITLVHLCLTYQTNAGSGNCNTMINPMATRMRPRFIRAIKQHIPLVFGQN